MIATAILARLLTPHDFGLVALGGIIIVTITTFVQDLGFNSALIQRQKDIEDATNIVFYTTIVINLLLFLAIFLIAPFAADFFHEDIVTDIIRISAIGLIIGAFSAGHQGLMIKNLEYRKVMKISIISGMLSSLFSVILVFLGFSYWSLVYGNLLASPLTVILYWHFSSWRPKFSYNRKVAWEMIKFGGLVTFTNLFSFFNRETDKFFIGKFLNSLSLGIYNMGRDWGLTGANQIGGVMNNVLFPTFSSIKEKKEKVKSAYLKALKYINLLTIPLALGTIAIASEFVTFILGKKWVESVPILQIFAVYGLFSSLALPGWSVLLAVGKVKISAKLEVLELIFILVFIYPLLVWKGIVGVCLCVTLSMVLLAFTMLLTVLSILDMKFSVLIKLLRASIIASIIMFFSVMIAKMVIGSSIYTLFILIFIGITIYFSILYIIDKEIFAEFKEILSAFKK